MGEEAWRLVQWSRWEKPRGRSWESQEGRKRVGGLAGVTLMQPRARQPATLVCTSSSSSWSRKHSRAWVRVREGRLSQKVGAWDPSLCLQGSTAQLSPFPGRQGPMTGSGAGC